MNEKIFSKSSKWLLPYFQAAAEYYDISRIKKVRGIKKLSLNKLQACDGWIWKEKGKYEIHYYMSGHTQTCPDGEWRKVKRVNYSKVEILHTVAHEIAHVIIGLDHTPLHKIVECKLTMLFMSMLEEEGYVSEEEELKSISLPSQS